MEKFKKKKGIIIIIVLVLAIISSIGTGVYYNNLILQTQQIYWNIELPPNIEIYNEQQKSNYHDLIDLRQLAFDKLDTQTLSSLQQKFIELDNSVYDMAISKEMEEVKKKTEILFLKNGNDEEVKTFLKLKEELINYSTGKKTISMSTIECTYNKRCYYDKQLKVFFDTKYNDLVKEKEEQQKKINERIENEKKDEPVSPQYEDKPNHSNDYNDYSDYDYSGGSGSGGSSGGANTEKECTKYEVYEGRWEEVCI